MTVVTSDAAVSFTGPGGFGLFAQRTGRPNPWAACRRRDGSAERWREAIPSRALVSTECEAGEAYAEHGPGRWLRDRGDGEFEVARPGREHNAAVTLRHQERQEIARLLGVIDAESRVEVRGEHLGERIAAHPVRAAVK
jgi:hypothetical protein